MLIKSPNSVNVYSPASFVDCIQEDGEVSEGEWRTNVVTDSFYSLQVPRTSHNASLYAKFSSFIRALKKSILLHLQS